MNLPTSVCELTNRRAELSGFQRDNHRFYIQSNKMYCIPSRPNIGPMHTLGRARQSDRIVHQVLGILVCLFMGPIAPTRNTRLCEKVMVSRGREHSATNDERGHCAYSRSNTTLRVCATTNASTLLPETVAVDDRGSDVVAQLLD